MRAFAIPFACAATRFSRTVPTLGMVFKCYRMWESTSMLLLRSFRSMGSIVTRLTIVLAAR